MSITKFSLINNLICFLVFIVYLAGGKEVNAEQHLVLIEKPWVPDSVYSPDNGIDFEWKVWWWRWESGLTDKKPPAKTMVDYSDAYPKGKFPKMESIKDILKTADPARLPSEPKYLREQDFRIIVARDSLQPDSLGIWIVEEKLKSTDPDTTGAHFFISKRDKEYRSYNSRYRLIVKGDTVMNFIAIIQHYPRYPIIKTKHWEDGYSFLFQRYDGNKEGIEGKWKFSKWKFSIHAVVNGEDLNERGYENTLAPVILDDKLLFLYQKDRKWGWNYNGEEHPDIWDRVYYKYGDGECGAAPDPTWKSFCALRDGMWFMVKFEREVRKE